MSSRTRHNVSPWWLVEGGEPCISGRGPQGTSVALSVGRNAAGRARHGFVPLVVRFPGTRSLLPSAAVDQPAHLLDQSPQGPSAPSETQP